MVKNENFLRIYHISRIKSVKITSNEFIRDFKLIEEFESKQSNSFGIFSLGEPTQIKLNFDKQMYDILKERTWHSSQRLTKHDNFTELTMNVFPNEELISWILGWGNRVIKIKPHKLALKVEKLRGC